MDILKRNWNSLRNQPDTLSVETKEQLIDTIGTHMKQQLMSITLRHDASRIVQCLLQLGSESQRRDLITQLCEGTKQRDGRSMKIADIAKTPYGHFVVIKAISYGTTKEEQNMLVNGFQHHYVSLATNAIGARIIETMFQEYQGSPELLQHMWNEFLGQVRRFTLALSFPWRCSRGMERRGMA